MNHMIVGKRKIGFSCCKWIFSQSSSQYKAYTIFVTKTLYNIFCIVMKTTSVISLVTGSLALFFNIALIPIILKFSSSMIGSYKYLLLSYTCSAALYAILQILTLPVSYSDFRWTHLFRHFTSSQEDMCSTVPQTTSLDQWHLCYSWHLPLATSRIWLSSASHFYIDMESCAGELTVNNEPSENRI